MNLEEENARLREELDNRHKNENQKNMTDYEFSIENKLLKDQVLVLKQDLEKEKGDRLSTKTELDTQKQALNKEIKNLKKELQQLQSEKQNL